MAHDSDAPHPMLICMALKRQEYEYLGTVCRLPQTVIAKAPLQQASPVSAVCSTAHFSQILARNCKPALHTLNAHCRHQDPPENRVSNAQSPAESRASTQVQQKFRHKLKERHGHHGLGQVSNQSWVLQSCIRQSKVHTHVTTFECHY